MTDKKLYRSRTSRIIAGVAAGIAEYLDLDPVVVRLAFVILAFIHSLGVWLYIIGWLIIPEAPESGKDPASAASTIRIPEEWKHYDQTNPFWGTVLILLGILFLFHNLIGLDLSKISGPLVLVLIGLFLIARSFTRSSRD